ncbi:amine oxidase, partial [Caerostris darwini]
GAIEVFREIIKAFFTCEPHESSLLAFLWYIKQCGGMKRMVFTKNGGQERKFVGGSQQISEKLVERLGADLGKEYKTKYVILACSPLIQMKIHFNPPLPPLRNQLMHRMPKGSVQDNHRKRRKVSQQSPIAQVCKDSHIPNSHAVRNHTAMHEARKGNIRKVLCQSVEKMPCVAGHYLVKRQSDRKAFFQIVKYSSNKLKTLLRRFDTTEVGIRNSKLIDVSFMTYVFKMSNSLTVR